MGFNNIKYKLSSKNISTYQFFLAAGFLLILIIQMLVKVWPFLLHIQCDSLFFLL